MQASVAVLLVAVVAAALALCTFAQTCQCEQITPHQCDVIVPTSTTTCTTISNPSCSGCLCVIGGSLTCQTFGSSVFEFTTAPNCVSRASTVAKCPSGSSPATPTPPGSIQTVSCGSHSDAPQWDPVYTCNVPRSACPNGVSSASITSDGTLSYSGTVSRTNNAPLAQLRITLSPSLAVQRGAALLANVFYNQITRTYNIAPGETAPESLNQDVGTFTEPLSSSFNSAYNALSSGQSLVLSFTGILDISYTNVQVANEQKTLGATISISLTCL